MEKKHIAVGDMGWVILNSNILHACRVTSIFHRNGIEYEIEILFEKERKAYVQVDDIFLDSDDALEAFARIHDEKI